MKITRNVILDLLPLYLAGEVSADTRALVEKFLETDSELANVAKKLSSLEKPEDIPGPVSQDNRIKAYKKARRLQILYVIILAGAISILAFCMYIFFFGSA
jgi:hypothetical protein